jgi:hypothetical protein
MNTEISGELLLLVSQSLGFEFLLARRSLPLCKHSRNDSQFLSGILAILVGVDTLAVGHRDWDET